MAIIDEIRATIGSCVRAFQHGSGNDTDFILIGGAGSILAGSKRTTRDLDFLLVAGVDLDKLRDELLKVDGFTAPGGVLTFRGATTMTIDFLTTTVLEKTFEDLREHTFTSNGVRLLQPDVALAIKLHCINRRAEDQNGVNKQATDLQDIVWLSDMMARNEPPMVISDQVAASFNLGHYNLLLTRFALEDKGGSVDNLLAVGVKKLLRSWEEDTPEQKEYFLMFAAPGSCPLTCTLLEEEEEEAA